MTTNPILVLDDDPRMLDSLGKLLRKRGYEVLLAADGQAGLELVRQQPVALILTDLKMPAMDGLGLLREVKRLALEVEVIVFTGQGSIEEAVEAMKQGAWDFLTKPIDNDHLLQVIARALEKQALAGRARALEAEIAGLQAAGPLIAESPAMKRVLEVVRQVSASDATVLLEGETGTGKELLARAIHSGSSRKERPLIAVNCAAIPNGLLESELFGHERGAFTGALQRKPGKFEVADGGTLFLDEVGTLRPEFQAKLLRVLQERQVERVGGTQSIPADARIIAASNVDLRLAVRARSFREDLYYRLNVVRIEVPPLRQRRKDIPALVRHFIDKYGGYVREIAPDALEVLMSYSWPGNVRELENVIQRCAVLTRGPVIQLQDLPMDLAMDDVAAVDRPPLTLKEALEHLETHLILRVLESTGGNQSLAAERLGIHRNSLRDKLKRLSRVGQGPAEPDSSGESG